MLHQFNCYCTFSTNQFNIESTLPNWWSFFVTKSFDLMEFTAFYLRILIFNLGVTMS